MSADVFLDKTRMRLLEIYLQHKIMAAHADDPVSGYTPKPCHVNMPLLLAGKSPASVKQRIMTKLIAKGWIERDGEEEGMFELQPALWDSAPQESLHLPDPQELPILREDLRDSRWFGRSWNTLPLEQRIWCWNHRENLIFTVVEKFNRPPHRQGVRLDGDMWEMYMQRSLDNDRTGEWTLYVMTHDRAVEAIHKEIMVRRLEQEVLPDYLLHKGWIVEHDRPVVSQDRAAHLGVSTGTALFTDNPDKWLSRLPGLSSKMELMATELLKRARQAEMLHRLILRDAGVSSALSDPPPALVAEAYAKFVSEYRHWIRTKISVGECKVCGGKPHEYQHDAWTHGFHEFVA